MKKNNLITKLTGKVTCVTGASGYIGKVIAETLCQLDSNLILVDINSKNLNKLKLDLSKRYHVQIDTLCMDLTKKNNIHKLKSFIMTKYKHLHILINSLGFVGSNKLKGWSVDYDKQTEHGWNKAIEVNLTSVFFLIQSLHKIMKKTKNASIINISSIYGSHAPDYDIYSNTNIKNPAGYAISKAGLNHLTKWLAVTLSPEIRVNTISPGGIFRKQDPVFVKKYIKKTPLNRMGTESDIVGAIILLSTDMSLYITGQNIVVDGGWTLK